MPQEFWGSQRTPETDKCRERESPELLTNVSGNTRKFMESALACLISLNARSRVLALFMNTGAA